MKKEEPQENKRVFFSEIIIDHTRRRRVDDYKVASLARDIAEKGLLHPVTLYQLREEKPVYLAAGYTRIRACKTLGWKSIPAVIKKVNDHEEGRDLEDAENLERNELNAFERCRAHARRKRRYILKHPEAAKGGDRRSSKRKNFALISSYSSFASKEADKSNRTIDNEVRLGEILEPIAEKILSLPILANSKQNLTRLSALDEAQRLEVLEAISAGRARTVGEALKANATRRTEKSSSEHRPKSHQKVTENIAPMSPPIAGIPDDYLGDRCRELGELLSRWTVYDVPAEEIERARYSVHNLWGYHQLAMDTLMKGVLARLSH